MEMLARSLFERLQTCGQRNLWKHLITVNEERSCDKKDDNVSEEVKEPSEMFHNESTKTKRLDAGPHLEGSMTRLQGVGRMLNLRRRQTLSKLFFLRFFKKR